MRIKPDTYTAGVQKLVVKWLEGKGYDPRIMMRDGHFSGYGYHVFVFDEDGRKVYQGDRALTFQKPWRSRDDWEEFKTIVELEDE